MTSRILAFGICLTLLWHCHVSAATPPVGVEEIARILQAPPAQWLVTDETAQFKLRKGESYVTVHRISREDRLVYDIWVETAQVGHLWNTEIEQHLASYSARRAEALALGTNELALFDRIWGERLSFNSAGQGYVGFWGDCPGGAGVRAVASFPALQRDVAISVTSAQGEASEFAADKQWQENLKTNYVALLRTGLEHVASRIAGIEMKATPTLWSRDGAAGTKTLPKKAERKSVPIVEQNRQTEAKKSDTAAGADIAMGSNRLFLGVSLAALAVIAWFLLKGRLR